MSHFSKIDTSIQNISLLKKTLVDLGFDCLNTSKYLTDSNGLTHSVSLVAKPLSRSENESLIGFHWNGQEYSLITDLDFWQSRNHFDFFLEKLKQNYSMNIILDQTTNEGFQKVNHEILVDGSIKLTVQRWI
uniref:Uncharacterized protein ycf35 n=1 Tax=Antithamnionella ternifolia TaxID=207919 RepID=A0A4D6WK62_9FLOR|nr:hypothetical protein [Antithamnionella ternifolia]